MLATVGLLLWPDDEGSTQADGGWGEGGERTTPSICGDDVAGMEDGTSAWSIGSSGAPLSVLLRRLSAGLTANSRLRSEKKPGFRQPVITTSKYCNPSPHALSRGLAPVRVMIGPLAACSACSPDCPAWRCACSP